MENEWIIEGVKITAIDVDSENSIIKRYKVNLQNEDKSFDFIAIVNKDNALLDEIIREITMMYSENPVDNKNNPYYLLDKERFEYDVRKYTELRFTISQEFIDNITIYNKNTQ
jgi:hypothetical protein